jgi:hypothetical protein
VIPELPAPVMPLPFEAGPFRMAMGLVGRPMAEMIAIDADYPAQMALRRELLAERHEAVFAAVPGTEAARAAALAAVADVLCAAHPAWFAQADGALHNRLTGEAWRLDALPCDPLEVAARLVQEDLCVVAPEADGPRLVAGAVCFPSHWDLREKLGRPLAAVHGPVPVYPERLARPVDRLMVELKPGRLVERLNWGVVEDDALHRPAGHGRIAANPAITAENAATALFLRVERQTLSRLATGDVLFTIRVHVRALGETIAPGAVSARLAAAIRALPPEMERYKSIRPFRAAVLAWLDRRAAA